MINFFVCVYENASRKIALDMKEMHHITLKSCNFNILSICIKHFNLPILIHRIA